MVCRGICHNHDKLVRRLLLRFTCVEQTFNIPIMHQYLHIINHGLNDAHLQPLATNVCT